MRSVLTSFHGLLTLLQREPNKENYHLFVEQIERFRAEWLQIANLQDGAEPDLADEYKALMDEWERVEDEFQWWALRETPAKGSAQARATVIDLDQHRRS